MVRNIIISARVAVLIFGAGFLLIASVAGASPPSQWASRGVSGGGALFGASFSPFNANELYLGCDMSDLFHSTDLGASWNIVDFRQIQSFHSTKVNFTDNANILYTIDYTSINGSNTARPKKSTDGGVTWSYLPGWSSLNHAFYLFADPNSTTNLIVTTKTNLYFSNDGGTTFNSRYTDGTTNGLSIGGVFWDGVDIYVGTNAGLLVSGDGGISFVLATIGGIPGTEAIFSMAGAKTGAVVRLFASTITAAASVLGTRSDPLYSEDVFGSYQHTYTLDIGQANWIPNGAGIAAGDQPLLVAAALNDITTAYLAGQVAPYGQAKAGNAPVIYKTSNGGGTWQSVFVTNNNQNISTGWGGQGGDVGGTWWIANTPHDIAVAPNNSGAVVFTDKDGVPHLSSDGGANWHQIYTDPTVLHPANSLTPKYQSYRGNGLEPTLAWWIVWDSATSMFAAFADINAIRSKDGGATWSFDLTGLNFGNNYMADTYHFVKSPATGALYAAQSNGHGTIYEPICLTDSCIDPTAGAIRFSTDGGQTWSTMTNLTNPVLWMAIDPNTPGRMYAAVSNSLTGGIYLSNDYQVGSGATWTRITSNTNPAGTEGHPLEIHVLNDGTLVATFSGRYYQTGTATQWGFSSSSGVFISSDGGTTWTSRSDTNMRHYTKALTIDPNDATQSTWYAGTLTSWGTNGSIRGGLYKTTDRGQNWTLLYNGDGVESATVNPHNPDELYVATRQSGLLFSNNATAATPTFPSVTSFPFARPTRVVFNPYDNDEIWVATNGNGLRVGRTGYDLTVTKSGAGSGTVAADSGIISWGGNTGTGRYSSGTVVTLTASTGGGSAFSGWSGACSGAGACQVTMDAARSVTATFVPAFALSVTIQGTGSGTVSGDTGAISCMTGSSVGCSASFGSATVVNLTATPAMTSSFSGWSMACSNSSGTCSVTMDADKSALATFSLIPRAQVSGTPYGSLISAYAAVGANGIIEARVDTFSENLLLNRGINITLRGGFADSFDSRVGFSTLQGTLTIINGKMVADGLLIH